MTLAQKIRQLRQLEGDLRGLGRELTQAELVRGIKQDLGATISQSYLSQIENGSRPHLTNKTRSLLSRFFKVHPGYLVDDPEGFHTELLSDVVRQAGRRRTQLTVGLLALLPVVLLGALQLGGSGNDSGDQFAQLADLARAGGVNFAFFGGSS